MWRCARGGARFEVDGEDVMPAVAAVRERVGRVRHSGA